MPSWRIRSPKTRSHQWSFSGHLDDLVRANHGTGVNAFAYADNIWGTQCLELDGDTAHVNVGDVAELNAVEKFTIAFWMNQDVIPATDFIFDKTFDANNGVHIQSSAGDLLYFFVETGGDGYGRFAQSIYMQAAHWYHIAMVFDGTQPLGNANRLIVYLDGVPITLAFTGTIQAATYDLSGIDATWGAAADSLAGKLFDGRIYSVALTRDEVNDVMRGRG